MALKLVELRGTLRVCEQVQFSRDGNFLYTGARRDPDIFCWDVRFTSDVVYRMQRQAASTNQRIQFDIEPNGRHLATGMPHCFSEDLMLNFFCIICGSPNHNEHSRWGAGGTDGKLLVFDLRTGEPIASHNAAADTLNGVQFHPFLPLAATASGAQSLYKLHSALMPSGVFAVESTPIQSVLFRTSDLD